jgi:DNA-binding NarL/FixJ family response regulator
MTENRYDVLVAEDEAIVALEIKQLLSRHNFNVVGIVRSGEDLIRESETKNPDVIVSDISLKGKIDGIDAVIKINESKDIPVIFVTGHGDDSTYLKALNASPSAYLLKPFSERNLINSVRHSVENSGNHS